MDSANLRVNAGGSNAGQSSLCGLDPTHFAIKNNRLADKRPFAKDAPGPFPGVGARHPSLLNPQPNKCAGGVGHRQAMMLNSWVCYPLGLRIGHCWNIIHANNYERSTALLISGPSRSVSERVKTRHAASKSWQMNGQRKELVFTGTSVRNLGCVAAHHTGRFQLGCESSFDAAVSLPQMQRISGSVKSRVKSSQSGGSDARQIRQEGPGLTTRSFDGAAKIICHF
jgi:hypothetical protein